MFEAKPLRRYPRVPSDVAISVSVVTDFDKKVLGLGKDIGGGGCMFICNDPLKEDQLIQVEFGVGLEMIKALAKVAFIRLPEELQAKVDSFKDT